MNTTILLPIVLFITNLVFPANSNAAMPFECKNQPSFSTPNQPTPPIQIQYPISSENLANQVI